MAIALHELRGIPDLSMLALEERLVLLVQRDQALSQDRRLTRQLLLPRNRYAACTEDVNFRARRDIESSRFLRLADGEWIRQHQTLVITGSTVKGKSWLACALGNGAGR